MESSSVDKCKPIYTLEELHSWQPPVSSSLLQKHEEGVRIGAQGEYGAFKRLPKKDVPKTLVCHDMKGIELLHIIYNNILKQFLLTLKL